MTPLAMRLFFTPPLMPLHEALHVLRLVEQVKDVQAFFRALESQASWFTNYASLLSILKDHYGFTQEENPFKKARIATETYAIEEKIFAAFSQEEKVGIARVKKAFQGRVLFYRPRKPEDEEGIKDPYRKRGVLRGQG